MMTFSLIGFIDPLPTPIFFAFLGGFWSLPLIDQYGISYSSMIEWSIHQELLITIEWSSLDFFSDQF